MLRPSSTCHSARTRLLGGLAVPRQNEGKQLQSVVGESVASLVPKEKKGQQAARRCGPAASPSVKPEPTSTPKERKALVLMEQ